MIHTFRMRKTLIPGRSFTERLYNSMPALLEDLSDHIRGNSTFHLDIEPGDRTNYKLFFAEADDGWYIVNEHTGLCVFAREHDGLCIFAHDLDWSPDAMATWCSDVGVPSWNTCTLHVIAQILEDLANGKMVWYDWEKATCV